MQTSWVYIMASGTLTLYIGVTSKLESRVWKHKTHAFEGFSAKYNCNMLVYFEEFADIEEAIQREKQLKGWRRSKKLDLITTQNPDFVDLAKDWFPNVVGHRVID